MQKKSEEPIPGLRDFMANSALSILAGRSYLSDLEKMDTDELARFCYRMADSMLKERDKRAAT